VPGSGDNGVGGGEHDNDVAEEN